MPYTDSSGREWVRTSTEIQQRAKELRQRMTPAEKLLWTHLRRDQLGGLRFQRQHPVGPFIADFYCAKLRLIVEIDGSVHDDSIQKENDEERAAQCKAFGYTVLRFTNEQVESNIDIVLQAILSTRTMTYHDTHTMIPHQRHPSPRIGRGAGGEGHAEPLSSHHASHTTVPHQRHPSPRIGRGAGGEGRPWAS